MCVCLDRFCGSSFDIVFTGERDRESERETETDRDRQRDRLSNRFKMGTCLWHCLSVSTEVTLCCSLAGRQSLITKLSDIFVVFVIINGKEQGKHTKKNTGYAHKTCMHACTHARTHTHTHTRGSRQQNQHTHTHTRSSHTQGKGRIWVHFALPEF